MFILFFLWAVDHRVQTKKRKEGKRRHKKLTGVMTGAGVTRTTSLIHLDNISPLQVTDLNLGISVVQSLNSTPSISCSPLGCRYFVDVDCEGELLCIA